MRIDGMQTGSDLFGNKRFVLSTAKANERAEFIGYFFDHILPSWHGRKELTYGYIAWRLTSFSISDMHYLKSICEDSERRGYSFSKTFFGSLKVK